jgi:serine/threonine protein kinase
MESGKNYKFKIGQRVAGWEIKNYLNKNASSEVYLASKESLKVALKVFSTKKQYPNAFREFSIYKTISKEIDKSPKAIALSEENAEDIFVATEYIEAQSLQNFIDEKGPMDEEEWLSFAKKLLGILEKIHRLNVIHRDIKPSNILIKDNFPILIDYELSFTEYDLDSFESRGDFEGTPDYSSPEHTTGQNVPEMDIFSAASTLLFAGTGKKPFSGSNEREIIRNISRSDPKMYNLSDTQKNFLSLLFVKNKSDRLNAHASLQILKKFEKTGLIYHSKNIEKNNQSIADELNIYDIADVMPYPTDKLFESNKRRDFTIRISSFLKNSLLFFLAILFYITPLIYIVKNLVPDSIDKRREIKSAIKTFECLDKSFNLDSESLNSKIEEVKRDCNNVDSPKPFLINIAVANINKLENNPDEQERNLIKAARLDNYSGLKNLISFYAQKDNFQTFGEKWLIPCEKNDDSFCAKVLAFYYENIGSSDEWIHYSLRAIQLGDVFTATHIDSIFRKTEIGMRNLPLIVDAANNNDDWAIEWLAANTGEKKWIDKSKSIDAPFYYLIQTTDKIKNKNYEEAVNLGKNCEKKYPLERMCLSVQYLSFLSEFQTEKLDRERSAYLDGEISKLEKKIALLGDVSLQLEYAKAFIRNKDFVNAKKWLEIVANYNEDLSIDAYMMLSDIFLKELDFFQLCEANLKAKQLIDKNLERSESNENYVLSKLEQNSNLDLFDLNSGKIRFENLKIEVVNRENMLCSTI